MHVNAISDIGLVRKDNEDNYLASPERGLFIVADGMGGHLGGQMASSMAVKTLDAEIKTDKLAVEAEEVLRQAFNKANKIIFKRGQEEEFYGMGTTVTAALFYKDELYIAHIGDSRAYLLRDSKLTLLTQDHSLVNELVQQGGLTREEAFNHPQRNILTRALGTKEWPQIDLQKLPVYSGDYLLLCTDGLHNHVRETEMLRVLQQDRSLASKVQQLVDYALECGGTDNITVVLVQYE